jgi:cytoskeletal protein RodZ
MNEQNQKPEWFALADEDKAATPSRLKKSAKVTLLLFPLVVVLTGVAYANLHQESAANAESPVISQTSVAPVVAANSLMPTTQSKSVIASNIKISQPPQGNDDEEADDAPAVGSVPTASSAKAAPMNPIAKAPRGHGREGGEGRENHGSEEEEDD